MTKQDRPALLFASSNPSKILTYKPIFESMGLAVCDLSHIDPTLTKPVEDAPTVIGNAIIKARHYHSAEHPYVFAEDIGICFDALNDEPGVQARRWGGLFSDAVDDQTWMDYLLDRMKDVPEENRTGRFVVGWAVVKADGSEHTLALETHFRIAQAPIRPMIAGSPMTALIDGQTDIIEERRSKISQQLRCWHALNL